jgi:copper chaperone
MKLITLKIDGMMCGMCESHVNDVIRKNFKINKVTSSHSKNETKIITDEDISLEKLKEVITPTGYKILDYKIEEYQKKNLFQKIFKK